MGRVGKISDNVQQNFFAADCDDDKLRFLEYVTRSAPNPIPVTIRAEFP